MLQEVASRKLERGGNVPTDRAAYHLDAAATTHVARILRNMYSRPVEAVVREYLANAVDAQVLHQQPIEDIVVELPTPEFPTFSVQDTGPGLSREDTEKYLLGFGSSGQEKRESNQFVGGFGIGCKCGFAVTDQFFYVIRHGGLERRWRCYLDESDTGMAELVHEEPTKERTGIKVEIPVKEGQVNEYVSAFVRVAWLLRPIVTVARGLRPITSQPWVTQARDLVRMGYTSAIAFTNAMDFKETWNWLLKYMDLPEFWRGKFTLNGLDVKWTWIQTGTVIQGVMRKSQAAWVKLGWQLYPISLSSITGSLKPEGSGIELFESTLSANNGGSWILEVPIGTFALSPTREDLQYSIHTQKMLAGALNALVMDWLTVAKNEISTYASNLKTVSDYSTLSTSGLGDKLVWVLKVLKRNGGWSHRGNTTKAIDHDITTLATWKLPESGLLCDVRLDVRSDIDDNQTVRPWLVWRKDRAVTEFGRGISYFAKIKWHSRHGRSNPDYMRLDYAIRAEDFIDNAAVWRNDAEFRTSDKEILVVCCTPEEHLEIISKSSLAKRYPALLLSFGNDLAESLGILKLGPKVPDLVGERKEGWWCSGNRRRRILLAWFVQSTALELETKHAWLQGLKIVDFKDLKAAYKVAHKRIPKTAIDPATGAVVAVPTALRAPPRPLDSQKYCMAKFDGVIDVVKLRDASARPYIRTCRGAEFWPTPDGSVARSYIDVNIVNSEFPTMAKVLDPKACGILETRAESRTTPNPDRYGNWVPLQDWFFEKLEARAKAHGISEAHMARLVDLLHNKSLLFPSGRNTDYVATIDGLNNWDGQFNKEMRALYLWLRANVTCDFGLGVLDTWSQQYDFEEPGTWDMMQELIAIQTCLRTKDGWLDMPRKSNWAIAYGDAMKTLLKTRQDARYPADVARAFKQSGVFEYKQAAESIKKLNSMMNEMFHDLAWCPIACDSAKKLLWEPYCRRTWLVFEAAWSLRPCPVIPALPK